MLPSLYASLCTFYCSYRLNLLILTFDILSLADEIIGIEAHQYKQVWRGYLPSVSTLDGGITKYYVHISVHMLFLLFLPSNLINFWQDKGGASKGTVCPKQ